LNDLIEERLVEQVLLLIVVVARASTPKSDNTLTPVLAYKGQVLWKEFQGQEIVQTSIGWARPHPEYPEEYKALPVKGKSCPLILCVL